MKLEGVRAILFDLDGTFADTAPDLARALNEVRAERGLAPLPPEAARPHTSSGARGLLKVGFGVTPESPDYAELRERFLDFYEKDLCVETRIFDGIPEVIAKMRARKVPWGIVTNKGKRFTGPLLRLLAVDHLAACAVSGDSTPHTKPHPAPLLLAAELVSLAPAECLYVGDDLRDAQAARAAGMAFAAAGWGYLGEGGDPRDWNADALLAHPREILDLLP
ncbi:MAG TPA: HAD-IA family hydrolase [Burkholderiales bacterium]|nr:HAD-IA family hydrolase [Burkholderiales bacterium]